MNSLEIYAKTATYSTNVLGRTFPFLEHRLFRANSSIRARGAPLDSGGPYRYGDCKAFGGNRWEKSRGEKKSSPPTLVNGPDYSIQSKVRVTAFFHMPKFLMRAVSSREGCQVLSTPQFLRISSVFFQKPTARPAA